jgi:hypothetical protein
MKHLIWTLAVTASLAAPLPAASQHAVPRGGGSDGGGSSSSGGSSGGSSSGGSSGGGSTSSGGSSSSDGGGSSWAPPRHPGGSSSSGRSRGDSGSSASGRRSPGNGASSGSGSGSGSGAGYGNDRVVGGTSGRTRDGRPITGYAVPRGTVEPGGRPGGDYYYYPRGANWYYSPWYYYRYSPFYYSGYGASLFGLGYIWDPFWFGGDPYADRFGFAGGGYGYGGGYAGGGEQDEIEGQGALRIKVKPREAKVLVDGTFAGTVDDFDGNFQKLRLDEGSHKVELQADGFEPLRFDVLIVEGQTVTYKGQLRER